VIDLAHIIWHGDRFEHLRIFDRKVDRTLGSIKVRELRGAKDSLSDGES